MSRILAQRRCPFTPSSHLNILRIRSNVSSFSLVSPLSFSTPSRVIFSPSRPLHSPWPPSVSFSTIPRSTSSYDDPLTESQSSPPQSVRLADFRSDTVTKPTPEMYISILDAQVGDDVYGEDPTVRKLEVTGANLLEMEDAVYVPTATMANLLSVGSWCNRGESVILGDESHIFHYEQGGVSWLMGAVMHTVPNANDGTLPLTGPRSIQAAIDARGGGTDPHFAKHACVAIENTQNRCGGTIIRPEYMKDLTALCQENNLPIHIDGARLMNAAAALKIPAAQLVKGASSVSLCLSKGLGAPMGALVIGSKSFVARARRLRKAVGGGMRQVGIAAAPGLVGLASHAPKLGEDHTRAKSLARGLAVIPGLILEANKIQTNIVFFDLDNNKLSVEHLRRKLTEKTSKNERLMVESSAPGRSMDVTEVLKPGMTTSNVFAALISHTHGCRLGSYGTHRIRAVTHHQINDADVEYLIEGASIAAKLLSSS